MTAKQAILTTAFLEGASVLIVELAGARALAPFYGTSLTVWTSQITATLLFLALGYGLGGRLSKAMGSLSLPGVFWGAGVWLALFPFMRNGILTASATLPGIGAGSFAASALLFGPVLLALGAVSPLLIQKVQEGDRGGAAAGSIFFTNTLGGLAGGWLTALWLVPHYPLRLVLAATGVGLALLGSVWAWPLRKQAAALGVPVLCLVALLAAPRPLKSFQMGAVESRILHSQASGVGLIQVLDIQRDGYSQGVSLLLDGITQGGMERESGLTAYEFTEYQARLSWAYHPQAERALLLGLGSGVLAKSLHLRGLSVDVAEIEPKMEGVARRFFGLPAEVRVHAEDGRAFVNRSTEQWDLIFLDAFAGESAPWYLMTVEGLQALKARLAPGGRLLINSVTRSDGSSAGLLRLEAGLLQVFEQAQVFVEGVDEGRKHQLVNACVVAGAGLKPGTLAYPGKAVPWVAGRTEALLKQGGRPARAGQATFDDFSDLDAADAGLRKEWRQVVLSQMGAAVLND